MTEPRHDPSKMPSSPNPPSNAPEGTQWFGGPAEWFAMSLRFYGDNLVPDEITQHLGTAPTTCYRKGALDPLNNRSVRPARTGSWKLRIAAAEDNSRYEIDEAIAGLLKRMTSDLQIWQSLSNRFRGDLFVGVRLPSCNKGIELLPSTLLAIGLRGLKLGFDIYYESNPETTTSEDTDGI